jgi:hypothetical protein
MKNSTNQIKISLKSIIDKLDQAEDRTTGIEDKI